MDISSTCLKTSYRGFDFFKACCTCLKITKVRLLAISLFILIAAFLLAHVVYMLAKAELAQVLIKNAWEVTLQKALVQGPLLEGQAALLEGQAGPLLEGQAALVQGQAAVKPWPWADTWPVARLQYGDNAREDLYVLAGAMGNSLAFGPGHMMGTARPGEQGNSVIGGHRDSHFAFLADVTPGDLFRVQTIDGAWHAYRVTNTEIRNINDGPLMLARDENQLQLITCYPFSALRAGGPLRYLVSAQRLI